ncbi:MAG: N-acetyltransferase [Gemmatimonadetes bacterium]|nr:N-acetyltransferase [Gemmatimonadota bacterium]
MKLDIRREDGRFVASTEAGEATLEYSKKDSGTIEYESTFVPEEARGRGIGERLVTHALDWASEQGYRVVPTCSFVQHVLEEKPEYRRLTG